MDPDDIRRIRVEVLKLSRAQLAKLLGVSPRTVESWERMPTSPAFRRINRKKSVELLMLRDSAMRAEREKNVGW